MNKSKIFICRNFGYKNNQKACKYHYHVCYYLLLVLILFVKKYKNVILRGIKYREK